MAAGPARPDASLGSGEQSNGQGRLLTAEDVAARWQVPKAQVYRHAREGRLPAVRIGRYYRFRLVAVEAFELEGGSDE
jgi:excisionase family DNA binding protein